MGRNPAITFTGVPAILDKYIARLGNADRNTRLETLLDLSRTLPPLPEGLLQAPDREQHRVAECQTPVHLWVEVRDGRVHLFADVPRESPTVRGFVALLIKALDGVPPDEVARIPDSDPDWSRKFLAASRPSCAG